MHTHLTLTDKRTLTDGLLELTFTGWGHGDLSGQAWSLTDGDQPWEHWVLPINAGADGTLKLLAMQEAPTWSRLSSLSVGQTVDLFGPVSEVPTTPAATKSELMVLVTDHALPFAMAYLASQARKDKASETVVLWCTGVGFGPTAEAVQELLPKGLKAWKKIIGLPMGAEERFRDYVEKIGDQVKERDINSVYVIGDKNFVHGVKEKAKVALDLTDEAITGLPLY